MNHAPTIQDIRREYGDLSLNEALMPSHPMAQFNLWFEEVLKTEHYDPTAVVLSTVDERGDPDSRVVLLKGLADEQFVFYTNYHSAKAQQLENHPYAALNFYWAPMARQVRVRGAVVKTTKEQSDAYFATRPLESQLGAMASHQSEVIAHREALEEAYQTLAQQHNKTRQAVMRPPYWGGYALLPEVFEFWQGRDNRLHDRIRYVIKNGQWQLERLAP